VWNHAQLLIKQAGFVANTLAFDKSTFFTLSGRGVRQGPYSRHHYLRFEVVDCSTFTFSEDVKYIQRAFAPARSFNTKQISFKKDPASISSFMIE
jgi:hypothetical protein